MKILKKIIAIVLLSIVAVSCSKDDEGVIETQTRKNLLLKTTDSDDGLSVLTLTMTTTDW